MRYHIYKDGRMVRQYVALETILKQYHTDSFKEAKEFLENDGMKIKRAR
jgi:hypothetical protein